MSKYSDFTILIPCYNEEKVITTVLQNMSELKPRMIMVVDDGSKDGSVDQINKFIEKRSNTDTQVKLLQNKTNQGQGASLMRGIESFLAKPKGNYVITVDADNQHTQSDVILVMDEALRGNFDYILSQRDFSKVGVKQKINNILVVITSLLLFGMYLKDPFCGLRCYHKKIMSDINFFNREEWNFSSNDLYGRTINRSSVTIPATYTEYSKSKGISYLRAFQMIIRLVKYRLSVIFRRDDQ